MSEKFEPRESPLASHTSSISKNEKLESTNAKYIDDTKLIDATEENRLVRKIDLRLLPIFILLYLLSFLDRANIGNAKITGLVPDLHISTKNLDYNLTLAVYFIGYVLFEVPSNIVLKRFSPRAWLPTIMLSWGIVSTLMGLSQSFSGLLAARFFLGVTEAGLFPGVVYLISQWYKREEQHIRISLFFSAASLAGAFGGILAYAIGKMDGVGGKHGWSWIFILEGLLTVVVALLGYLFVPNYPATTSWLTEEEKSLELTRLSRDSDAARDEGFKWSYVVDAFKDWQVYGYCLGFFSFSLPLYSFSLFLPTIIANLGFTAAKAQLLTVPTYTVSFLYTFGLALLSYKYQARAIFIIISAVVAIIGYVILLATSNIGAQYFGTYLVASGVFGGTGIVLSWPSNNLSGQLKRAVGCALQIALGDLAAIIGVLVYYPKSGPRYVPGHIISIAFLTLGIVTQGGLWWLLRRENRLRANGGRNYRLEGHNGEDEQALLLKLGDQHPNHRFQL